MSKFMAPIVTGVLALLFGLMLGFIAGSQMSDRENANQAAEDLGQQEPTEDESVESDEHWFDEESDAHDSEPEPPAPTELTVGDTHTEVNDTYGDSYTFTITDVRYVSEIPNTEYGDNGSYLTAFDGEGYFALITLEYTNDSSENQEYIQLFDSYVDPEGTVIPNDDEVEVNNSDGYDTYNASDIGANELLENATVPSGTTVEATEVVPVPAQNGQIHSYGGEFYLTLSD
jgi:hypothetical protein